MNEGGSDRSVSDNQSSSVTLNELAREVRKKPSVISSFSIEVINDSFESKWSPVPSFTKLFYNMYYLMLKVRHR